MHALTLLKAAFISDKNIDTSISTRKSMYWLKAHRVKRKAFGTIVLMLLLNWMLAFAFNVQTVEARETIYIRADGSVDPSTASILNYENVSYTFTSNINDSIIVERDNIVIDGAGYTLQGVGSETGIDLTNRSNVTVQNTKVTKFYYGIYLEGSSNINISGNTASNNTYGIMLNLSTNNTLVDNRASNNTDGIYFVYSDSNILYDNVISSNMRYGVMFSWSPNNSIFHNNFIDNANQNANVSESVNNQWNDDYPSGGNYWSDYKERYPNATEIDNLGIWNTPYTIDENNQDNYPLITPWDINPPLTTDNYDGLWHITDFTINLTAIDELTDVEETYYKINDNPEQNVTFHGQPLITTEGTNNTLEYWSIDKAGNNETHRILTEIKLDKTTPKIETPSRTPEDNILPEQPVKVSVNATDAISGVKNVTLYYTIDNGTAWEEPIPMNLSASTNLYEATIPGQEAGTWVQFKIVAYDHAGNNATRDGTEPYFIYQVIPEFASAIILPLFIVLSMTALTVARRKISNNESNNL